MTIYFGVEDILGKAVAERLLEMTLADDLDPIELAPERGGIGPLEKRFGSYCQLAKLHKVLLIVDLDSTNCAPSMRNTWMSGAGLTDPLPNNLAFCIAVRETESWLLSDRANFSEFLGVSPARIPSGPEEALAHPKEHLLAVARYGRGDIKRNLLPAKRSRAKVGLGYNTKLIEFVRLYWDVERAAQNSTSLSRAINKLRGLEAN